MTKPRAAMAWGCQVGVAAGHLFSTQFDMDWPIPGHAATCFLLATPASSANREGCVVASSGYRARRARLVRAAGVGSAVVRLHEDTWRFITSHCWTKYNKFPLVTTDHEEAGRGMKEVSLSGPNLALILTRMGRVAAPINLSAYNRSVARRIYEAVAAVVDTVDPDAENQGDMPVIVIDDRPPRTS